MSRDAILNAVKNNKPNLLPLPKIDDTQFKEDIDLKQEFKNNIALVGANIIEVDISNIDAKIKSLYPSKTNIVAVTSKTSLGTIPVDKHTDPHTLGNVDLAIIEGDLGVSENGAIWVSATNSLVRALPFITNDLVIILNKDNICLHMLEAYSALEKRERNFGVFISGPSKTADIEQCLVVGAHGAMSLTVVLI